MDYKAFEYIYFHTQFQTDENRKVFYFVHNPDDRRQCNFVAKCKNMSLEEFDKIWLPLCEKQKIVRRQRLEEFEELKPSDFFNMPLQQKLLYIDAISGTQRAPEEWTEYFREYHENLRACLFNMQPSPKFLMEEQRDLTHFMNALIGVGLDKAIRETKKRTPEQQKQDMQNFAHIFSKVYHISEPKLQFGQFSMYGQCGGSVTGNKWADFSFKNIKFIVKLDEKDSYLDYSKFGVLFHELIHARQTMWQFSDDEKYALFSRVYGNLDTLTSYQELNYEIYRLLPRESHAYFMQRKFEEQCNERIYRDKPTPVILNAPIARTLWYDYQR